MNTNHEEWKQLVSAYIDDELSSTDKDTLHNHLVDCPACQKYLKELQSLSQNVSALNNQTLSPDLEQRLNNLNSRTERSPMNKTSLWKVTKTVVPVVVIAVLIALTMQIYVKRGIQGRMRSAADDIGNQYSANNGNRSSLVALGTAQQKVNKNGSITWKDTASTTQPSSQVFKGDESRSRKRAANKLFNASEVTETQRGQDPVALKEKYWGANSGQIQDGAVEEGYLRRENDQRGGFMAPQYPYAPVQVQESNTEQYDLITENDFHDVTDDPLSTFSIDVDTASYANVRRMLNSNQFPPPDSVRIEEMINYFKYNYSQPGWNQPFSINLEHGLCPWNTSHQIVLIGLQGKNLTEQQTPPSNLVFLIDVSGSMNDANKLPLLKESLKMMVAQLRPEERISMVVYAGNAGVVLDSTPGYNKGLIMNAIDNLQAGGSTAGGQGIHLAYNIARKNFINNGNNRVILATDGDFNVGVSSDSELVRIIEEQRQSGIFLTVLGFGTGNLQDGKMEKLADKGNGNYFYIDSLDEGKKVLVDELGSTILTIAKDVKIQVEFNPQAVKAYRLIGYENRKLANKDFNDDKKDAGEMGAGHTVTALYEIVPAGSWENAGGNVDPLKYQKQTEKKSFWGNSDEMMTVKLRYKEPKSETSQLLTKVLKNPAGIGGSGWFGSSDNIQFASAVAEFGMLLRNSSYTANSSYQAVIQRAQNSAYNDQYGYKNEFIGLVQKAASLDNRARPQVPVYQQQVPVYQQYEQPQGYQQK